MKICYHGTDTAEKAASILKEGFRDKTWFARNLQDALAFGGKYVFCVVFDDPPDNWQFVFTPVGPEKIVKYSIYEVEVLYENADLRQKVFESNMN